MNPEMQQLLPEDFPNELIIAGNSLLEIGCKQMAWQYKEAMKAAEWYCSHNYAILGGDVLKREKELFVYIGDSWYSNQNSLNWAEYVAETRQKTLIYIENYYQRNGNSYYYALTTTIKISEK